MKHLVNLYYYVLTKCTYCGIESRVHPPGDGCHNCSRGSMQPVDEV